MADRLISPVPTRSAWDVPYPARMTGDRGSAAPWGVLSALGVGVTAGFVISLVWHAAAVSALVTLGCAVTWLVRMARDGRNILG